MVERIKVSYRNSAYYVDRPNWDGGDVVMAADFAELEAEVERLTKERDKLTVRLADFQAGYDSLHKDVEHYRELLRREQSALDREVDRTAALSRTGAMKVKELEWGPYHNPVFAGPDIAVASFSVFGLQLYQAQRDPQGPGFIVFLAPKYGTEFWSSKGHADLDEAKAAAQADFDRRILSALEPHPRATSTVDAHETVNVSDKPEGQPVTLTYRNWRGEISERTITPKHIWFGSTEWHPEPQWLITAFDLDKQADRDFALKDFISPPEGQQAVTEAMVEALKEARSVIYDTQQACLFDDDDGQIGVTEDAVISPHHFQKLCRALGAVDNALKAAMEAEG